MGPLTNVADSVPCAFVHQGTENTRATKTDLIFVASETAPSLLLDIAMDGDAAMTIDIESARSIPTRPLMKVVVVSKHPGRDLPKGVLDVEGFDVVFIESIASAYTQIKRVTPDLVIMCLSMDDPDACRVLSMLKWDRETCHIPVATYTSLSSSPSDNARAASRRASSTSRVM